MKKVDTHLFIESLIEKVRSTIFEVQQLRHFNITVLSLQPNRQSWSVAQVIQHLNIYNEYYIPTIENKLHLHNTKPLPKFTSGWLGNYFTHLMEPKSGNNIGKKMKAMKSAIPQQQPNAAKEISAFIQYQHQLLQLLQVATNANLQTIRIPTSLNKWVTLSLGDTFRFLIAHQERHFVQIKNTLSITSQQNKQYYPSGSHVVYHQ